GWYTRRCSAPRRTGWGWDSRSAAPSSRRTTVGSAATRNDGGGSTFLFSLRLGGTRGRALSPTDASPVQWPGRPPPPRGPAAHHRQRCRPATLCLAKLRRPERDEVAVEDGQAAANRVLVRHVRLARNGRAGRDAACEGSD